MEHAAEASRASPPPPAAGATRRMSAVPASAARIGVATAAGLGAIALVSGVIALLRDAGVPVLSLGALYVVAVLAVAVTWGAAVAVPVGVLSMLTFNFLFLPPTGTLHLRDGENWLALGLYLVVAIVAGDLATRVRRRATEAMQREREASALASIAGTLLAGGVTEQELERVAADLATVLGAGDAALALGPPRSRPPGLELEQRLRVDGKDVGSLWLDATPAAPERVVARTLAMVAATLHAAEERERLGREALAAETLRASDAVKTTILRTVSHDLRTPLTAIRAAADGLASPTLTMGEDDRRALARTVVEEADRLERLVRDLLDLSQLEAGVARPRPALWPVDELVSRAIEEEGLWDITDLELPEGLPPLEVDPVQLDRALANVLANARRHARSRISATARQEGNAVVIRIANDGPPITADDAEWIFEPFAHGPSHPGSGGHGQQESPARTGLGLAIARGFVEANGGTLTAEHSGENRGACFAFRLPVAPDAERECR